MELSEDPFEAWALTHFERFVKIKEVISGGIAGCCAKSAVAPLNRVTVLMQVQSMRPHKFSDGVHPNNIYLRASLQKIFREQGLRGFWQGNCATLIHRFPYTSLSFYFNAKLREELNVVAPHLPDQLRGLIAGGTSATLAVVPCYPLDVVKTRLMAQTKGKYYNGIADAVVRIAREEGVGGLYRGLPLSICSVVPSLALNFTFYEEFYDLYSFLDVPPWFHTLLAGGSCGAAASAVMFPVDLLRRQMQMVGLGGRPSVYTGVSHAARHIYSIGLRNFEGRSLVRVLALREFFRGLTPELLKVVPNNAILFCIYKQLLNSRWPMERTVLERRESIRRTRSQIRERELDTCGPAAGVEARS